jgi:heme/copper-type cytochrome/quinol oxidase subunit 2
MQMKIVVESKEDFKKWLSEKQTFAQVIKAQESNLLKRLRLKQILPKLL